MFSQKTHTDNVMALDIQRPNSISITLSYLFCETTHKHKNRTRRYHIVTSTYVYLTIVPQALPPLQVGLRSSYHVASLLSRAVGGRGS